MDLEQAIREKEIEARKEENKLIMEMLKSQQELTKNLLDKL